MKRRTLALTFGAVASLLAVNSVPAQTLDLKRLDAVADSVAHAHIAADMTPGMTVAVAKDGEIVFARGYGEADVEMDSGFEPAWSDLEDVYFSVIAGHRGRRTHQAGMEVAT